MRWVPFLILTYAVVLLQTTVVQWLSFMAGAARTVQPDLLAMVAVFVALFARGGLDVMLAAWALGLAADLTAGAAVGIMPVTYALAAGAIFRVREVFFRERFGTRFILTLVFCLMAHGLWATLQSLISWRHMDWGAYGRVMLQAGGISLYTAALAPAAHWLLERVESRLIPSSGGRTRR
jgi:rod shape-determining protein MreD